MWSPEGSASAPTPATAQIVVLSPEPCPLPPHKPKGQNPLKCDTRTVFKDASSDQGRFRVNVVTSLALLPPTRRTGFWAVGPKTFAGDRSLVSRKTAAVCARFTRRIGVKGARGNGRSYV